MMTARLRSDLQVAALKRLTEADGLMFMVLHKGHEEAGIIFVKWLDGRAAHVYAEGQTNGDRGWIKKTGAPVEEAEADRLLAQEQAFDPDLWVVEVIGRLDLAPRFLGPA